MPSLVLLLLNDSADIPDRISPDWKFIVFDFAILVSRTILLNKPIKELMHPCSHSGPLDPIIPSSE